MYDIKKYIGLVWLGLVLAPNVFAQVVMDFSKQDLESFKQQSFVGNTAYETILFEGEKVLKAVTDNNASALYREIEIDVTSTPYLTWRWQVQNTFNIDNQEIKAGDDYPARVYVVIKTGIFPWQTRALNYVWSNIATKKSFWSNPFTEKAVMIPLRSTEDEFNVWYHERVNVVDDYFRVFGERLKSIQGVAIMSDSDNNGGSAVAYYGNIGFTQ